MPLCLIVLMAVPTKYARPVFDLWLFAKGHLRLLFSIFSCLGHSVFKRLFGSFSIPRLNCMLDLSRIAPPSKYFESLLQRRVCICVLSTDLPSSGALEPENCKNTKVQNTSVCARIILGSVRSPVLLFSFANKFLRFAEQNRYF